MALNARQTILYTDTVDVFNPVALAADPTTKRLMTSAAGKVNATAAYTNEKCKYFPSYEIAEPSEVLGRALHDTLLTMDYFHFQQSVIMYDGSVIKLKTVGHPDTGTYYRVQGNPESWASSSFADTNINKVFVRRIPAPKELVP